jgi:vancomycin permeability regulator SanA
VNEWNVKVTTPMSRVYKHGNYVEGSVFTDRGIVYVYSQGGVFDGVKDTPSTTLQIVLGGRLYSRTVDKRYTLRGLVTVANRFAQEVEL